LYQQNNNRFSINVDQKEVGCVYDTETLRNEVYFEDNDQLRLNNNVIPQKNETRKTDLTK